VVDSAQQARRPSRPPAALALEYRLDDRIALAASQPYRHVERWVVAVLDTCASTDGPPIEIGHAHVLVFNLEPGDDICDYADPASGTWVDNAGRVGREPSAGEPLPDNGSQPSHVLVLDRVWLHPESRGHGLGPIIAAAVIERLGRGCDIAACYPAPFETPTQASGDRDLAIEALGKLWSKVGFTHWRDGVWMLDLSTGDRHAALAKLLATASTAPDADGPHQQHHLGHDQIARVGARPPRQARVGADQQQVQMRLAVRRAEARGS
jgi:GNAT superfamily N-acetyltransferase